MFSKVAHCKTICLTSAQTFHRVIATSLAAEIAQMPKKTKAAAETNFNSNVTIEQRYTIKGGLLKKFMPVETAIVQDGHSETIYVKLCKQSEWLCQAVSGECPKSRPLARTKLLEDLVRSVMQSQKEKKPVELQCDEPEPQIVDAAMAAFADDWEDSPPAEDSASVDGQDQRKARKLPRCSNKNTKERKVTIIVPEFAPEAATTREELAAVPKREVTFWVADTRRSLYIRDSDISWAMAYLHKQFQLCGVSRVDEQRSSPSKSPKADNPLRWDYGLKAYIVQMAGVEEKIDPLTLAFEDVVATGEKLTQDDWNTMNYSGKRRCSKLVAEHKLRAAGS